MGIVGIGSTFVDLEMAVYEPATHMNPLAYLDRIANTSHLRLINVFHIVALTRQAPLVLVDNTFLSPLYVSLFLHGPDIVAHSLTKYINGHSGVVMGAAILPSSTTLDRDYDSLAQKLRFLQNAHGAIPSEFSLPHPA
ncbi:hypothetical protein P692DRAFT_20875341 [Suillus brevipes Sb2]|nr:hypothetical protein P692DRAFT_201873114 [Suillus brevipes Sb2]KAG2747560.1 hypothetical protein P692DRAFT_20875341 [Suillus brevipes Sb2]